MRYGAPAYGWELFVIVTILTFVIAGVIYLV